MVNVEKYSRKEKMMDELKIVEKLNKEIPKTVEEMFIVDTDYKTLISSSLTQTVYMLENKLFSRKYGENVLQRVTNLRDEFIKFANDEIEYKELSIFKRTRKTPCKESVRIIPEFDYNINTLGDSRMILGVKPENSKLNHTFIINNGATFACYNKGCEFRKYCYNNIAESQYPSVTPSRLRSQVIIGIIHDMIVKSIKPEMNIKDVRNIAHNLLDTYYFNILKNAFSGTGMKKCKWIRFNESNELLDDISIIIFDEIAKFMKEIKDVPAYIYTHNTNVHIKLFNNISVNLSNRIFDDEFNTYTAVTKEEADYIMEHKEELEQLFNKKIVFCLCALEENAKCGDCDLCKYNKSLWIIEVLRE